MLRSERDLFCEMKVLAVSACIIFMAVAIICLFKEATLFGYFWDVLLLAYFSLKAKDICKLNFN